MMTAWYPDPENCQFWNSHTSEIRFLHPDFLTNNRRRSNHISELHAKGKIVRELPT